MRILVFSLLTFFSIKTFCQDSYNKAITDKLFNKLPVKCQQQLVDKDTILCSIKNYNYTLYKTTKSNVLVRYGLSLFPYYVEKNEILNFIEREVLFYILSSSNERKSRKDLKSIDVYKEDYSEFSSLYLNSIINHFKGYNIQKEGLNYNVSIFDNIDSKIIINFPANYNLITGLDKPTLQNLLLNSIKNYSIDANIRFTKEKTDNLITYDDIYIDRGETFLIGDMNTNIYYQQDKTGIVFDSLHIKESFSNLFLTNISLNKEMSVNLKMKNYDKIDFLNIKLNKLLSFFEKDYRKYFGVEKIENNKLKGSLLLYNESLSYMHLLDAEINIDDLFIDKSEINIKMYSFIPADNIKTLFGVSK
jgi:hypothetical protein